MNKRNSEMLGNMNVRKLLIKLAIPGIAAMVFNALYNLVDTFFVALGEADTTAIGALGIAYPIQMIVLGLGMMIGIGSASVFSRAFGRGDEKSMKRAVNTALLMNLTITLTISVIAYIFIEPLLRLFGATSGNIGYARDYLSIILIALVPFSLSITFNNLTRAEGRAKVAMISLMIGAIVNIALDPVFIFDWGLGMGVAGAALATAVGKTLSFIYVFSRALSKESSLMVDLTRIWDVDFSMVREIIVVGLPAFVRIAMGGVLIIIVNNLIIIHTPTEALGEQYISIYSVINRLLRFSLMPGFGLVQGMQPIVGFNYGAKFYARMREAIRFTSMLLFIYFTTVFLVVQFAAEPLFMIFEHEGDTAFVTRGARAFRIVALGFSFITFQVVMSSVYQAMGFATRAFFLALSRRFLVFVPVAILLSTVFGMGVSGIWWTFVAADIITGAVAFMYYRGEMVSLRKKYA